MRVILSHAPVLVGRPEGLADGQRLGMHGRDALLASYTGRAPVSAFLMNTPLRSYCS
jgi:hypothetical protein